MSVARKGGKSVEYPADRLIFLMPASPWQAARRTMISDEGAG
jgi:hypothetical protein